MKNFFLFIFFAVLAVSVSAQSKIPDNFVKINGGTFTMGSPANEQEFILDENDEAQHQVTVSSFYMGKYEVTQKEYEEIMGTNFSTYKGSNLPITDVSWFDAVEYCNRRSQKEGLMPAYTISGSQPSRTAFSMSAKDDRTVTWNRNANGYRLPTEAEWEYACRAGTTTPYSTGSKITAKQTNFPKKGGKPTNVGSFASNPWGLYDMHGNVQEWCWDWYGSYSSEGQTDPTGPASGEPAGLFSETGRVVRGGSVASYNEESLRSANRSLKDPSKWDFYTGFRVVRP